MEGSGSSGEGCGEQDSEPPLAPGAEPALRAAGSGSSNASPPASTPSSATAAEPDAAASAGAGSAATDDDIDAEDLNTLLKQGAASGKLSVSNWWISKIPKQIWKLDQLRALDLSANCLKMLPKEIGQLGQLKKLSINHNEISVLPNTLWTLSRLTALYMNNNKLKTLSANLRQLSNLRILDLSANKLTELPRELAALSSLVELRVRNNRLEQLPRALASLCGTLQVLSLDGNPMQFPGRHIIKRGPRAIMDYLRDERNVYKPPPSPPSLRGSVSTAGSAGGGKAAGATMPALGSAAANAAAGPAAQGRLGPKAAPAAAAEPKRLNTAAVESSGRRGLLPDGGRKSQPADALTATPHKRAAAVDTGARRSPTATSAARSSSETAAGIVEQQPHPPAVAQQQQAGPRTVSVSVSPRSPAVDQRAACQPAAVAAARRPAAPAAVRLARADDKAGKRGSGSQGRKRGRSKSPEAAAGSDSPPTSRRRFTSTKVRQLEDQLKLAQDKLQMTEREVQEKIRFYEQQQRELLNRAERSGQVRQVEPAAAAAAEAQQAAAAAASWEIQPDEITLGRRLGRGSYGEVWKGLWRNTPCAIKKLYTSDSAPAVSDKTLRELRSEVDVLCRLRHPSVTLFMGACCQLPDPCIVMEYVSRGSLARLLSQRETVELGWPLRVEMLIDVARGMNYLHSMRPPIMHRDLKTDNLLVDDSWQVKLADFGLAKTQAAGSGGWARTNCGTVGYAAPEVLQNRPYTDKADVYSFGVVMWEVLTRDIPYREHVNTMAVIRSIDRGETLPIPADCPPRYADLMRACWDLEPSRRPSFRDVLQQLEPILDEAYAAEDADNSAAPTVPSIALHEPAGAAAAADGGRPAAIDADITSGQRDGSAALSSSDDVSQAGACNSGRSSPQHRSSTDSSGSQKASPVATDAIVADRAADDDYAADICPPAAAASACQHGCQPIIFEPFPTTTETPVFDLLPRETS
eukprot:TRINITY_DN9590_c0_g2_i1.p1 TRINITY_DN9590_c0_g2~~TRINITY_DN9590_c0_g2_i1.p1  ORF type:complete len:976 (+),score=404.90 TRINITY_DN9590_c0_g2_i1:228-3155(+)